MHTLFNENNGASVAHPLFSFIRTEVLLRFCCVAILWSATFWCIQQLHGQVSPAFVVTGRIVSVGVAGFIILRQSDIRWSLLTQLGHCAVLGLIYAILPMVLVFCIARIVPKSSMVVGNTLLLLGFGLARCLHNGRPLRLRILVMTNVGIIAFAWLISTAPGQYLAVAGALLFVLGVNSSVTLAARLYTTRHFATIPAQVPHVAGHFMALAWLLPLVSWYGTALPPSWVEASAMVLIWSGAVVISWLYRHTSLHRIAMLLAALSIIPAIAMSIPYADKPVQVTTTLIVICISAITLMMLWSLRRTRREME